MMRGSETIFAQATPAGRAAIAVIRISGPRAHDAPMLFGVRCPHAGRFGVAMLRDDHGRPLDQALILAMAGPRSSTGEDVVEIHAHGSMAVTSAILRMLEAADGFRPAQAGEFTHRMFANGKIDLLGSEALADLIDAETDLQRQQAWRQMDGALFHPVTSWREEMIRLGGQLEALIDFADEELPPEVEGRLREDTAALITAMQAILDDGGVGEAIRDGVTVSLLGPVNAGKSTLLNRLAGREAAIVSDKAGTTRDVVSVRLDLDGIPVTLLDTAGVRRTEDDIEAEGVRRALDAAKTADGAMLVLDASDPGWKAELESLRSLAGPRVCVVLNKSDLVDAASVGRQAGKDAVLVSLARDGEMDAVLDALRGIVVPANRAEGSIITRSRHRAALRDAVVSLQAVLGHSFGTAPEIAAEDYRRAADSLGRITGAIDAEDLLGSIFSSFCIGK
ncbi:MAG: tRNA uridine-5-carboxymethylaminomethyl(34) synthesis GTPase MnmE [Candidatus Puniceispirillaceae bacterium]